MKRITIVPLSARTLVAIGCDKTADTGAIHASGHIEATEIRLAAKVGGRFLEAPLEEGNQVAIGELVARFETVDAEHQLAQARANAEAADARLRLLLAGSRAEDLRRAEDQLAQAQAELDAARRDLKRLSGLAERGSATEKSRDDAATRHEVAERAVAAARAQLDKLVAGPRRQEIEAARAQRASAEAMVAAVEQQIVDATVSAPTGGVITRRVAEPGEVLPPGATLAVLTDLARPWLTVWIDEPNLSQLTLGQKVEVRVDGRERVLRGHRFLHLTGGGIHPQERPDSRRAGQAGLPRQGSVRQRRRHLQTRNAGRCLLRRPWGSELTDAPLLAARDLVVRYGRDEAVHGVSLEVRRGEVVGLIGPDGAGKTSTLRVLGGLQKATEGRPTAFGNDCWKARRALHNRLGYLAQRFALYGDLTVNENIQFFALMYGVPGWKKRRQQLLELVGLAPFGGRIADRLSGGMKQKLALACTLIHSPEALLLDEPTTGVDPVTRREFWRLLADLVNDGLTLFIATPYLDEAERCTRVLLMHEGRLLADSRPQEIPRMMPGTILEVDGHPPRRCGRNSQRRGGHQ